MHGTRSKLTISIAVLASILSLHSTSFSALLPTYLPAYLAQPNPAHSKQPTTTKQPSLSLSQEPRPRQASLHARLDLAQPGPVPAGAGGDRGVPDAQVGARARVPAAQGALLLQRRPHRRAVLVRVARRRGPVVAHLRPRGLDLRRRRPHAQAPDERERREHRRGREVVQGRRRCESGRDRGEALVSFR